jgi:hypothetical protein
MSVVSSKKKFTKLQSESDIDKFRKKIFCSFFVLLFPITISWWWIRSAQLDESCSIIIYSNYHIQSMAWYFLINVSIYCKFLGILDFHSVWLLSKIGSSSPLECMWASREPTNISLSSAFRYIQENNRIRSVSINVTLRRIRATIVAVEMQ